MASPLQTIGHYRIVAKLGEGGMGQVWRANDTRLNRDVAIKVLPEAFAHDADRMARFEREAHVLASLNHPNIAAIYGTEERALVMELVEGVTLAERINQEPMPLEEAIAVAKQIAEALEYAHERGVIHRDLKPANIKITPEGSVKVLDFGLAKAVSNETAVDDPASSPTLTMRATQMGMILGTAAYMAPEQAGGKAVDRRADIWSFGVVLYEMLTGKRLFVGESVSHTLAAVLKDPIKLDIPDVPMPLRRLLARCLNRNPRDRLRDIGEARFLLEKPEEYTGAAGPPAPIGLSQRNRDHARLPWIVAALGFASAAGLGVIHMREKAPAIEATRFQIPAPEKVTVGSAFGHVLNISPDGRRIAFVGRGPDGKAALWLRSLDELDIRRLAGTEDATASIWSPDGRFLAFGVSGKLKKIEVSGGPAQTLCDIPATFFGGSWNTAGVIIYAIGSSGLWRVSETGGAPSRLTELDASREEGYHAPPVFLPDGRHFIYFRFSRRRDKRGIYVGALDVQPEHQDSRRLLESDFSADYAPSPEEDAGHLLFLRENVLMAKSVDTRRLELTGEMVPIAENVGVNGPNGLFSVSKTGALVYATQALKGQLAWLRRSGEVANVLTVPQVVRDLALSPDGTRAVMPLPDNLGSTLFTLNLEAASTKRFTFEIVSNIYPIWSPDGSRIVFSSNAEGVPNLYWKRSDGLTKEELLLKSAESKIASDWSRDGKYLLYTVENEKTKRDLWYLTMNEGDRKPVPFLATEFHEFEGQFSPDTHFVAYTSLESGIREIYVRTFPNPNGRWQVSRNGGRLPRWRRDGTELFYISATDQLMSVSVTTGQTFQFSDPKELSKIPIVGGYDVSPDGQRFLISTYGEERFNPPMTVVLNWQAGLGKRSASH